MLTLLTLLSEIKRCWFCVRVRVRVCSPRVSSKAEDEVHPANEFGGPWGCFGIIAFSHFIVLYLYYCNQFNDGALVLPTSLSAASELFFTMFKAATTHGDWVTSVKVYTGFFFMQVRQDTRANKPTSAVAFLSLVEQCQVTPHTWMEQCSSC